MRAFLLAGGRSRRMGRDKAQLDFAGQPLAAHMLGKIAALGMEATICGNRPDLALLAPVLPDPILPGEAGAGPLAGILAALEASNAALNLFLAVDIPGVPIEFLRWMTARAGQTQASLTIPFAAGRVQPLCAVYHRNLASGIRRCVESGERRVYPALRAAASGIDAFDVESIIAAGALNPLPAGFPHQWFRNLNTPLEFALYTAQQSSNKLITESDA